MINHDPSRIDQPEGPSLRTSLCNEAGGLASAQAQLSNAQVKILTHGDWERKFSGEWGSWSDSASPCGRASRWQSGSRNIPCRLPQCFWRTGSAHGAEGEPSPGPPCVSNSMFQTPPPWPLGWALLISGEAKPIFSSQGHSQQFTNQASQCSSSQTKEKTCLRAAHATSSTHNNSKTRTDPRTDDCSDRCIDQDAPPYTGQCWPGNESQENYKNHTDRSINDFAHEPSVLARNLTVPRKWEQKPYLGRTTDRRYPVSSLWARQAAISASFSSNTFASRSSAPDLSWAIRASSGR